MGQYYKWKNVSNGEALHTFAFASGSKYLEQWRFGPLYTAIMVLLTDVSSLGHGGGDFRLSDVPEELKKFIQPMIGRWAGDQIVFSGDYTQIKEYKESDADGNETSTDISDKTALAVWTMYACDIGIDTEDAKTTKERLLQFLKENVCDHKSWESDSNLKPLLAAIEELTTEQTDSPATKRSRTTKRSDEDELSEDNKCESTNPAPPKKMRTVAQM
jgi:hypothetical protein